VKRPTRACTARPEIADKHGDRLHLRPTAEYGGSHGLARQGRRPSTREAIRVAADGPANPARPAEPPRLRSVPRTPAHLEAVDRRPRCLLTIATGFGTRGRSEPALCPPRGPPRPRRAILGRTRPSPGPALRAASDLMRFVQPSFAVEPYRGQPAPGATSSGLRTSPAAKYATLTPTGPTGSDRSACYQGAESELYDLPHAGPAAWRLAQRGPGRQPRSRTRLRGEQLESALVGEGASGPRCPGAPPRRSATAGIGRLFTPNPPARA